MLDKWLIFRGFLWAGAWNYSGWVLWRYISDVCAKYFSILWDGRLSM